MHAVYFYTAIQKTKLRNLIRTVRGAVRGDGSGPSKAQV